MCDREMTLEEYVGQLMKDHRARKEFEQLKAENKEENKELKEYINELENEIRGYIGQHDSSDQ